jgi:hypothetical protein
MKLDFQTRLRLWGEENGLIALIALILAVLVYLTILELVSNTTTRTIPVEIEREPGLALMAVRPARVEVTFRGALAEFQRLDRADLRVVVRNPRGGEAGVARLPLSSRNVRGAAGLRIVSIDPAMVEITFDRQGQREFAIEAPHLEGKPFRGRAEAEYTPRTAVVRGARLQLDRLHDSGVTLKLEPINIDGRVQGFSRRVAILPPAEAWMPEIEPESVLVKINITPDNIQREFTRIPVRLARLPHQTNTAHRFTPAEVAVRLTGWTEVFQTLSSQVIRVYADLPEAGRPLTNALPLQVLLPPGLAIDAVSTHPETVRLLDPAAD